MAGTNTVGADDSLLSRIDRALLFLEARLTLLGGFVIFALVLLAVIHVLSRKFLNAPVPGYVDWTEQFMATFAFLGLSYTQRMGGHIRMDIFVTRLRGRTLWLVEGLTTLLTLVVVTALVYGSWYHFQRSFDWNAPLWSRDSTIDISLPLWPSKLVVPFAMALLWLRLVIQLWAYGRALATGERRPPAVPLPEDPASLAAQEAALIRETEAGSADTDRARALKAADDETKASRETDR